MKKVGNLVIRHEQYPWALTMVRGPLDEIETYAKAESLTLVERMDYGDYSICHFQKPEKKE